jgi:hypothetical protein
MKFENMLKGEMTIQRNLIVSIVLFGLLVWIPLLGQDSTNYFLQISQPETATIPLYRDSIKVTKVLRMPLLQLMQLCLAKN